VSKNDDNDDLNALDGELEAKIERALKGKAAEVKTSKNALAKIKAKIEKKGKDKK
jgi:hypothetical protein